MDKMTKSCYNNEVLGGNFFDYSQKGVEPPGNGQ
jgi:hypothetical protein